MSWQKRLSTHIINIKNKVHMFADDEHIHLYKKGFELYCWYGYLTVMRKEVLWKRILFIIIWYVHEWMIYIYTEY